MNKIRRRGFGPHLLEHPVDKIKGEGRGWRLAAVGLGGRQRRRRPVLVVRGCGQRRERERERECRARE